METEIKMINGRTVSDTTAREAATHINNANQFVLLNSSWGSGVVVSWDTDYVAFGLTFWQGTLCLCLDLNYDVADFATNSTKLIING